MRRELKVGVHQNSSKRLTSIESHEERIESLRGEILGGRGVVLESHEERIERPPILRPVDLHQELAGIS